MVFIGCHRWLMVIVNIVVFFICSKQFSSAQVPQYDENVNEKLNAEFWYQQSIDTLKKRLDRLSRAGFGSKTITRPARNIILFIGDGHGLTSISASRKYKEELTGKKFYEGGLAVDTFPFSGFSKTYNIDAVIPDSAATATAYLTGTKTKYGYIGLDATGDTNCTTTKGYVDSIASWAKKAGKSTGLVTTTTITHASPSPLYAHVPAPLRSFEYVGDKYYKPIKPHLTNCKDIAKQFVENGQHLKLAFGGGRGHFTPNTDIPKGDNKTGVRNDGRNLINEWLADRSRLSRSNGAVYLTSREELQRLDPKSIDYALGLFHYDHMTFVDDNPPASEPTLTEMTSAAIRILDENKDGYFLFVEGGRIDHGHHGGMARYALREGVEFDRAIRTAVEMTDPSETLIVVTADHSHTLAITGYLHQNTSILGLSVNLAADNKTSTALLYADGPGFNLTGDNGPFSGTRRNESFDTVSARGYRQQAAVPQPSESHGGEDVPIYATGINSALFTGVLEQSYMPWAMACAAGISGPPGVATQQMFRLCPKPYRNGHIYSSPAVSSHHLQSSPVFASIILASTFILGNNIL